ncbi:regulatory iron-sulfur-containing complex subunit RicT [Gemmatimonas aurantiaca]|uniref:PSP1 domain-containing protein n=1 Tax=Gemmatimonas aurantiaca TaxID=173480 RepID=UPI00301D67A6
MAHLIEVAFRGNRKEFFSWDGETPPPLKAAVIVDADRGEDLGRVHSTGELADIRCRGCAHGCGTAPPARRALRLATRDDEQIDRELTAQNEQARRAAMERVKANGLVMKLTDAEWQWDRRKLTIYFTAERRVDFRALVRDLAALFKTRIELKQIGVRDEAKRLSGVGRCGREYCSSSWLPDLRPVNLGVAKDQRLSLNPQQISGACGRLMCCLRYEHEFYVLSRRKFPKEGKILNTSRGEEKVITCDIFHERVTLRTSEGDSRVITLAELRAEVDGFDASTLSTTMEHASPLAGALDAGTMSMLDTQEFETVLLASSDFADEVSAEHLHRPARPAENGAVVTASPEVETEAETEAGAEREVKPDTGDESDAPADADAPAEAAADAPRRKRRRGRRGGRRLRAAEERRRAETGESTDDPEQADEGEDGEAD